MILDAQDSIETVINKKDLFGIGAARCLMDLINITRGELIEWTIHKEG